MLSRLFGLWELERVYGAIHGAGDPRTFEERALHALDVTVSISGLESIPTSGPVLIAANHPHGALDGLALLAQIRRVRPDVRALANCVLARISELHERCFFIDPFERHGSRGRNRAGLRAAHRWLRNAGALIVFPSGEVAHASDGGSTRVDSKWHSTAGRLAAGTGATVVPVSIDGHNSPLFYAAGRVHALLRTALLPRELLRQRGATIRVTVHPPLARRRRLAPIAGPLPAAALAREIAALAPASCLVDAGASRVYCAAASAIPRVLGEIGRLREITYREVGEGTGCACDLDEFDQHYLHLFVWDAAAQRVAGAYRMARTDVIVAGRGVSGLYTRRLFRYDERLFTDRPPALELGRSFVRSEYQRRSNTLMLLWKGIGQFVQRHPEYRVLLGAVSISARYSDASQQLLIAFLEQHHRHAQLAELVEAIDSRPPLRGPARGAAVPATMAEVDALVRAAERDGKGVPVLLRQYLKLNARVLGFNVDPAFGDALDALMMVDLADVDSRILRPYFSLKPERPAARSCVLAPA